VIGRLIQIAWCFTAAAFLGFVWACVLLTRWHNREERNAAETERVLNGLLHDRTNDHIYDA